MSVNHHTLSDFRTAHGGFLDRLLTQGVAGLMCEGLVEMERVAQDGMRVRASAGAASFRRRETLEKCLAEAEEQVQRLRAELESDPAAANQRQKAARQRAARERLERVQQALQHLPEREARKKPKEREKTRVSTTDAEATVMKMGDGGYRPAYNVQLATDTATQIITGVDVVTTGGDQGQLAPMVEQHEERYQQTPEAMLVDGGFVKKEAIEQVSPPKGRHGRLRPGNEAQGFSARSAPSVRRGQPGGGGVAGANGNGRGEGHLQGTCRDGGVCQRDCPQSEPATVPRAWSAQGPGDRAVVCSRSQLDACGGTARRGGQSGRISHKTEKVGVLRPFGSWQIASGEELPVGDYAKRSNGTSGRPVS